MPDDLLHHLLTPAAWDDARAGGAIAPPSLTTEGFVHCSTADQLDAVVHRHYPHEPELWVAVIDPTRLDGEVRWEESHPGERYPHVYGPIGLDAVREVRPYRRA